MEIPIFKAVISDDDETGVTAIALVDEPAIDRQFIAMAKTKKQKFKIHNEEKRIIAGPLMVANLPILRFDDAGNKFYVVFDAKAIEQINIKFNRQRLTSSVNLMHNEQDVAEGVFLTQQFLINSDLGVTTPIGYEKLTNGSWFGFMRVENDNIWNEVKEGTFKGFSVEGFFNLVSEVNKEEEIINRIINVINRISQ